MIFGLYNAGGSQPLNQFEGDRMVQNGDHVYIFKKRQGSTMEDQVAAISLNKGQFVVDMQSNRPVART